VTYPFDSVAVVGGGLAGARAVAALREEGFTGRVSLIGAEPRLPYERPPLSKEFLSEGLSPDRLLVHPPEFYDEHRIELVLGRPATRLSPGDGTIHLAGGGAVRAGRVLLCTGVAPRRLGVPGEALPGVHALRDLPDGEALRAVVRAGVPVVVVGEGFIGSEVASTLAGLGADVTLLMGGDLPMQPVLGVEAGDWLLAQHRGHGISARPRSPIRAILGDDRVTAVELADGTVLPAGAVVVGIGSVPAVGLAADVGIDVGDGVLVDAYSRTSLPGVYAAGDLARFPSAAFGRALRVEHWQNAQDQATTAVRAMLGAAAEPYDGIPWAWSEQHGRRWEIAGQPHLGTSVARRGDPDSVDGALWVFSDEGRVRGAVAVGRRRELRAVLRGLAHGVTVAEHDVRDESVDIRTALHGAAA
jgi:3-phenylpropionate/trans-cinnamate dioxygenase ferredoxin reductase subunit